MQGNRTISYKFLETIIQSNVEVAGVYTNNEGLVVVAYAAEVSDK